MSLAWIVERFNLLKFASLIATLRGAQTELALIRQTKEGTVDREYAKRIALESRAYCDGVGFKDSMYVCGGAIGRLSSPSPALEALDIEHILRGLQESIERELQKHAFVNVRPANVEYFDRAALFGTEVDSALPNAAWDIKESGNCVALELYTAAVFHLMRVAEHGIRYLARRLKVSLTHAGASQPIEFADWNKILTGTKNQISRAKSLAVGLKRQAQLERWSDASDHCEYMKDIWRNNIAHTRKPYIQPEAVAALDRVRGFMQFLAGSWK